MIPDDLIFQVQIEHEYAISHFPPFASAHEGLAIIEEEFEELKKEVFTNQARRHEGLMRKEALQVATMALRFIMDVCEGTK